MPPREPRELPHDLPATPEDAARRERALLLRAYDSSTLTRENFCVLKRIAPETLDTLLAQARQEAAEARRGRDVREPREGRDARAPHGADPRPPRRGR